MSFNPLWHLRLERSLIFQIESLVRKIVLNWGVSFHISYETNPVIELSFLKHTLVAYGCHKSPKLTISIYRPRCATVCYREAEKKRNHLRCGTPTINHETAGSLTQCIDWVSTWDACPFVSPKGTDIWGWQDRAHKRPRRRATGEKGRSCPTFGLPYKMIPRLIL